jgi:aminoglycoside phosphotransferase (APT) family kinase protein
VAEWDRDLEVDPAEVRRAAGSPAGWRLLGTGWDCDAWLADESVVWRVPRRAIAIEPLRREAEIMPVVAPLLPLPVPVPRLIDGHDLPVLARHDYVPGRELAEWEGECALGRDLAHFLRALHAPDIPERVHDLVPVDPMSRSDPGKRVPSAHRMLDEVSDRLDVAPLRRVVEEGDGPPLELGALTHGDLHPRHVLVNDDGIVSGVIDWGDCCIGSPGVDLAIVTALPLSERVAFFRIYGEVDPRLWRHARLIGVHVGAALLASDPNGYIGKAARRWLGRLIQDGPSLAGRGTAL